jgi:hypothetical protein
MHFTATYFKDLAERCLKTFLQVFLATMLASMASSSSDLLGAFSNVDALQAAALAGLGAVASIIFSLVSAYANSSNGSASVVPEVIAVPPGSVAVHGVNAPGDEQG